MQKYLVIYEKTADGYTAYLPDLLGCVAWGRSKEEVRQNIQEAIKFHLEGLTLEGELPPIMETEAEMLEFA